eukprot:3335946-Amphidinium_carterae.2
MAGYACQTNLVPLMPLACVPLVNACIRCGSLFTTVAMKHVSHTCACHTGLLLPYAVACSHAPSHDLHANYGCICMSYKTLPLMPSAMSATCGFMHPLGSLFSMTVILHIVPYQCCLHLTSKPPHV